MSDDLRAAAVEALAGVIALVEKSQAPRECAEELMGRARCAAAIRPPESEGDYVRRMFRELHRRLVLPPEHGADSIDAAIGYALKRCEEEVMAALYASNAGVRRALPWPAPDVEAAWEALIEDPNLPAWGADAVIARHRPRIEAAIRASRSEP